MRSTSFFSFFLSCSVLLAAADLIQAADNTNDTKAVKALRAKADSGNAAAAYKLANMAKDSKLSPTPNLEEFAKYITLAISKDYPPAMLDAAVMMLDGVNMSRNMNAAFQLLNRLSKMQVGETISRPMMLETLYQLGRCYEFGFATRHDMTRAIRYYNAAAVSVGEARIALARACLQGAGMEKDPDFAAFLLLSAMSRNSDDAVKLFMQYDLLPKAVDFWDKQAKLGNPASAYYLADILMYGKGVAISRPKAMELYNAAANMGNKKAILTLAEIYDGTIRYPGFETSKAKAVEFYEQYYSLAPNKDLAKKLALYYAGKKNIKKHFFYLMEAGDLKAARELVDKTKSMKHCGEDIYLKSKEFEAVGNQKLHMDLLRMASNAEYLPAQKEYYNKAGLYRQTVKLLEKDAKNGNAESLVLLGNYYLSGLPGIPIDPKKAVDYLEQAGKKGSARANYQLARMYADGKIEAKDEAERQSKYLDYLKASALAPSSKENAKARSELYQLFYDNKTNAADNEAIVNSMMRNPFDSNTAFILGQIMLNGTHGVKKDLKRGLYLLNLARNGANGEEAAGQLLQIYKTGIPGVKPDQEQYDLLLKTRK